MVTRYNIPELEGAEQLPTGYDLKGNDPSTFYIPSCGLEDADISVHSLFDKQIPFREFQGVTGQQKQINIKKPFVIFATGERFALAKRLKPFRDTKTGALLLPAIAIRRTGLEQQHGDVFLGELTIKRRFDESDKDYQSLISALGIPGTPSPPSTLREGASGAARRPSVRAGMLLDPQRANHIYEIIKIPFPQFFTATYEVVFWSSYTIHMNYMIETFLGAQNAPGKGFKLTTDKGYWFAATVEPGLQAQDNSDDITDSERLIKYSFNIIVRGFILGSSAPGQKVPFKRYLSNVNISFEVDTAQGSVFETRNQEQYDKTKLDPTTTNPFVLTDIEEDPTTAQKPTDKQKIVFQREFKDPVTGATLTKYVKQTDIDQKQGETIYTVSDQETLLRFFADGKG